MSTAAEFNPGKRICAENILEGILRWAQWDLDAIRDGRPVDMAKTCATFESRLAALSELGELAGVPK